MKNLLAREQKVNYLMDFEEKLAILSSSASMIGYIPQIENTNNGKKILFTIYNCPFKNQISTNNEIVCSLHESYLRGQIDALFQQNDFIQFESMIHDCDLCKYEINILK